MTITAPTTPDIIAAVVAFLESAMGASLGEPAPGPGNGGRIWTDYAPDGIAYPYAVIALVQETYSQQSEDFATTGYCLSNLATGSLQVSLYASSKQQARALGAEAVRVLTDSQVALSTADARVMTIYATDVSSAAIYTTGTAQPSAFVRIVTFAYMQQFLI